MLGCALVGCTPVEIQPTDTPTPTVTITDTGLVFTTEEQAVVDAVQAYIEKWTYISQNVLDPNVDLNEIRDVATDPIAENALRKWGDWQRTRIHLIGGPVFSPELVRLTMHDGRGDYYDVYGCYRANGGYLADESGKKAVEGEQDSVKSRYVVLLLTTGRLLVSENVAQKGETC
jgi:hypothetical protein